MIKLKPIYPCMVLLAASLSACSTVDLVQPEQSVVQLYDLNDHDSDGVIEARDKCDNTVLGAAIDNVGCGTYSTYVEPVNIDIKFEHNSYAIPASALPKLKQLAAFLQQKPELKIVIEGHTSKVGKAKYNQRLSELRAQAVANILVNNFKLDPARVKPIGYGFERPLDDSDTEYAHKANRRIMAQFNKDVRVDDMIWTIYTVDQVD
ncbi:OmpA family protein [Paraglaciecola aestuariivivens]